MGSCSLCTCCLGGETISCRILLLKWEKLWYRVACFNRLLMKGHCSWSLKPSVYPDMVKAKIPIFAAVLSLESSYELPAAGYFVWGSSFLWKRGGLYLGHSWVPSPCIPPQHAFSVENKLFLGNNLLKASFLPAGTSEPWRSVAQKGCKAEGSMERSPPGWIHTTVTWYLISGWMQLLVQFWNCLWRTSCMDTHGKHTLQNMS